MGLDISTETNSALYRAILKSGALFRWFKFTLKPPYSIAHEKLLWLFGTLPCGHFWSNLDTRYLRPYPRTYSDHV